MMIMMINNKKRRENEFNIVVVVVALLFKILKDFLSVISVLKKDLKIKIFFLVLCIIQFRLTEKKKY